MLYAIDLPQEIIELTVGQVVSVVAFILAVVGAIVTFIKKVNPWILTLKNFLDDWNGSSDRPGTKGRAGVMERLEKLEQNNMLQNIQIADIKQEIVPNGGSSLKDQVTRIEIATYKETKNE